MVECFGFHDCLKGMVLDFGASRRTPLHLKMASESTTVLLAATLSIFAFFISQSMTIKAFNRGT